MNKNIFIKQPGLFTTIQDQGRFGYQKVGMPVTGAMDQFSHKIANMLVGNDPSEATIECTLMGPTIEFHSDELISITGANMEAKLNGQDIDMWKTIRVKSGDILKLSSAKGGLRTYIAFSSTLDVPIIMNSKSTFTRGVIGGFKGRKLEANDFIPLGNHKSIKKGYILNKSYIPKYNKNETIRVILGPQDKAFKKDSIKKFFNSEYTITPESDRMGYRLEGNKIEHIDGPDIISDGIALGSIQVPGHGQPIIMMADRQTAGGYTKIATVITEDLTKLAQMGPGSKIKFKKVDINQAQDIYLNYYKKLEDIKNNGFKSFNFANKKQFEMSILNKKYLVDVEEI